MIASSKAIGSPRLCLICAEIHCTVAEAFGEHGLDKDEAFA